MDKRRKKQFRILRNGHPILSILGFIIISAIVSILSIEISGLMINYIADSKLGAEFSDIQYMSRVYEAAEDKLESEQVYELLDAEGRDFFITASDGTVVFEKGNNTASAKRESVYLSYMTEAVGVDTDSDSARVIMRGDSEKDYVVSDEDGYIDIDGWKVLKNLPDLIEEVHGVGTTGTGNFFTRLFNVKPETAAVIPIWFEVPIGTDGEILCAKASISINMIDLTWVVVLFGSLFILVAVLMIVIFVNLIKGFMRRKNARRIFFTDISTHGKNWMWFLFRGESYMRSHSAKRSTFAVVNLVFVNYRNFCVCHSLAAGDEVLRMINNYLCKNIRRKELCARVNGAEFALLLNFHDKRELELRLTKMIDDLQHLDDDHIFHFQAGADLVGIARNSSGKPVKRRYFDMEIAYNNACTTRDTMAESEESGIAFFNEKMVEDKRWVDQVQEKQRQAIENEEFKVYYQPKYDPQTDELKGAEALIRWISPEYGFVPPGKIIPIFEKNGFITEIDHYMITHVAREQKRWLDQGFKCVPVSVNVSRAHFIENDLAEQIRDMVDAEGTPHEYIEIELTESAFFDDKKALIETITRLKSYGFAVSMDDFGSGYSSLNSLKDMPLDVLKLDAEFFRGEDSGTRGEIVVSEAIRLAKSLNMRTVAEGVEVKEQVEFLASQGCDMIQGYYYAKPMPGSDYEDRMRQNEMNFKRAAESVEAAEYDALPEPDESEALANHAENAELNENPNDIAEDKFKGIPGDIAESGEFKGIPDEITEDGIVANSEEIKEETNEKLSP
ncbi:MAG: bifunctional diguanylate cyclase/phosphodiesterase [Lachnospiraceae bacterium]|nr:bifunctional diguanylate cyclase/phosphodiesterase [Lachnospiraceae bacterium]